jgi:glycerol-3-phosphate dehydrogenase
MRPLRHRRWHQWRGRRLRRRGLSVALADERDFAEVTSLRSSKLIHGGERDFLAYAFRARFLKAESAGIPAGMEM